ncbi:MAG: RNA methyltransferase, partial [Candidatus Thorarchaeota archaeon]
MTIEIVLVEPGFPGNIGSTARVMKNFGFSNLVLINPRTEVSREAYRLAMHAEEILENARIFPSLEEYIKTVSYVVGTTAKICTDIGSTNSRVAVSSDDNSLDNLVSFDGKIGILFGREDYGLTNNEIEKCDMTIHIPTSNEYLALNLSQAVGIILYAISIRKHPGIKSHYRKAKYEEKEKLIEWFEKAVNALDFRDRKKEILIRRFRNIIGRAFVSGKEATSLLAVFSRA